MDDDGDAAAAAITPCRERKDGQIYRERLNRKRGVIERESEHGRYNEIQQERNKVKDVDTVLGSHRWLGT